MSVFSFCIGNEFRQPGCVPMSYETHGGEDVAIYAQGKWKYHHHHYYHHPPGKVFFLK